MAHNNRPSFPFIPLSLVAGQARVDIVGKEVQDPSSYSYTWMADQVGHVCLGILVYFLVISGVAIGAAPLALALMCACAWGLLIEDASKASRIFSRYKDLLEGKTASAAVYIVLGVLVGLAGQLAFQDHRPRTGLWVFGLTVVLGIVAQRFWLHQIVTWQRGTLLIVHVCIGILVYLVINVAVSQIAGSLDSNALLIYAGPAVLAAIAVSEYEVFTFVYDSAKAGSLFPVGRKLLAANAAIAAFYMILGVLVGVAMQLALQYQHPRTGASVFGLAVVLAIVAAPRWLRQKITWQKAALPFLFRLANVVDPGIKQGQANELQEFVNCAAPAANASPKVTPRQIIIGGPVGSGRTEIATAIGTEFAFNDQKVRYVTLTALLEFAIVLNTARAPHAARDRNDAGPDNIQYWPWLDAQVLIIDDIGPILASQAPGVDRLNQFKQLLQVDLANVTPALAACHTIWVFGTDVPIAGPAPPRAAPTSPASPLPDLKDLAEALVDHFSSREPALVIRLEDPTMKGPGRAHVRNMFRVELGRPDAMPIE